MSTVVITSVRAGSARAATRQLALVEGRRGLRHPAPWLGLALTLLWERSVDDRWTSGRYEEMVAAVGPLMLGISLAAVSAFARERVPIADDAPLGPAHRNLARLLGGLGLVAVTAGLVVAGEVWLRVTGGIRLGDEPGRTAHAHYSVGELLQPVLLAAFAVVLGAAAVHLLRQPLVAAVGLFVYWFLISTYWIFNGDVLRWLTPLQVQPVYVYAGPVDADPTTFPHDWLLGQPTDYQDHWARLIVSPSLAAWHDLYLVALTLLLAAVVLPAPWRRALVAAGVALAVLTLGLQATVTP
jgi:hypothetical protein